MTSKGIDEPASMHILYVNDDAEFAELVRTKLANSRPDFEITTVSDTGEALGQLSSSSIDCVVTCYSLPDGTGIELVRTVRAEGYDTPAILFTGRDSERVVREATESNELDYIAIHATEDSFSILGSRIRTLVEAARDQEVAERMSNRFRRTLERATDAIYAVDDEWRIEYMNEKMAQRVDRSPEQAVGNTLWEEFPSVVGTELETRYRTAMETGDSVSFEQRLGEPFNYWVEVRVFPDEDGLTVFSREITTERERELELERSETILQNIHDIVCTVNPEGVVQFSNSAADRLLLRDNDEELEGRLLTDVVSDRVSAAGTERLSKAIGSSLQQLESDGGVAELYDSDLQLEFETGHGKRTLDVRTTPVKRPGGDHILVVARDVTDQSEATRQLERERDALQELQAVMADSDLSAETRLEELLKVGCQTLGLEIGIISHIQDSDYTIKAVHAPEADMNAGDRFDIESTYCAEVVAEEELCAFADAVADGKKTHPAYREFKLESYIGVPLVVDGTHYGTVNFSSPTTRVAPFGALERTFVELVSQLAATEISRDRDRQELERQEFLFKRVQRTANIGIWEFAPQSGELHWSDGVRQLHGVDDDYEPSLADGVEFYHPDDRATIQSAVQRAIEDGDPYDLELRIVRRDGAVRDVRTQGERVDGPQRDSSILRGVIQDITAQKENERERRELAEEYESLLETSGDAIFLLDVEPDGESPTFEFSRLSPGYEAQTGLTTEAVRGKTPRAVFGDEVGASIESNYRRCVEQREPISYREELEIDDDARFWDTSLAPVIIDGEIVRLVGIARNVTEQVERERDLEATNQRLESLIETTPLTVMEIDPDGNITRWNDEAERMFGWSREEILGEFNPMVPEEKTAEFASYRQRALSGEQIRSEEIQRETKQGQELDLLLSVAPVSGPDGDVTSILAVLEDITEQKQLERKLRSLQETAQRLSRAQSSEEVGSIAVTAAEEILGFDLTALWQYNEQTDTLDPLAAGTITTELFGELPQLRTSDSLGWESFEESELRVYDDILSETSLELSEAELDSGLFVPLAEFGLLGVGTQSEQQFSDTDIDLSRMLGSTVTAAFSRANRETQLQRQNERLDQFASVVAHDLRNPLGVAIGFTDIVQETHDPDHFEKIENAHDRIERLIDDLLALARGETTITEPTDIEISAVATEAWGYVDTHEATLTVLDDVPAVAGDDGRLIQLFENLFRNAIEHGGYDVDVTVGQLGNGEGFYVEDNGAGIPLDRQDAVFDHGVTSSDNGTGFGLSIVSDIAKAHDWTVAVTDGTDGGARFEFGVA
ncbi:PAS domain-containing protein [Haloarcula sediminis]|uniref:PAS domain-containing protein n=1 Tax=Haloarcula sediminis TaxID=3111777 RepID=UPI002D78638C|nr:PAS domain-containing protein [Haloarcula sp. CK38]